ncbi:MAG: threonine/serine exporter family protein [Clostridia bacterium]|nr:threonine/serine exporter family protein [Clostridia bacterium]
MIEKLACAMDIGEQMMLCGAEVHRVEESIQRMCRAFGAERVDIFIIPSSMVATVYAPDGMSHTQTRRITTASTDFERLHRLNALSRRICAEQMTVEEIRPALAEALNTPTYPFWLECLCYAAIAGAFTLFFGGGLADGAVSFVIGGIVRFAVLFAERLVSNKIFPKFFSSMVATALAFGAVRLGFVAGVDKIIIGNIMTLIPGIGLTNALRDLFAGDSIAGILRTVEASLLALVIAAAYFIVAYLGGAVL